MVFLARFMPGIRTVFMFSSGTLGLRYWKFILYDFFGALIVVPGILLSVKWVAGNLELILYKLACGQWVVITVFAVAGLVFYLWKRSGKVKVSIRDNP